MSAKFWSHLVSQLKPYTPGEQPRIDGLIKLNTNENPYPPSPKVQALLDDKAIADLRLYPDPANKYLKQAIANHFELGIEQVCVGNGSDEVLAFAFQGLLKQAKPILFPDITYGFYPVYCDLYGIEYQEIPLQDDFSLGLAAYPQDNGGVIFANPNAPTGLAIDLAEIEQLLMRNTESVVIVDEAYIDFGGESAAGLINRYPNLLVTQTLSKSRSLAGSRVGFALGNASLIEALKTIKNCFNPYSVDRLAELAATTAMEDDVYRRQCCNKIVASREWITEQLNQLGFETLPSKANFIMTKPAGIEAKALFEQLREHKILVRYFSKPRIADYLRISIGSDEEMKALLRAVKAILADG
ncbi:MAG: histidinol-phosphate aminotransferase [Oceanicoccus sp.]|jgi:histidinol-phosphate aminotransferase